VLKKFFKKTKRNLQAGFSLLEMIMVLTVFGLITSIVTYNYGSFNNQITLTNLAYEIAMQIREAQVFSMGVRGANNTFDSHYGVYFKAGTGSFISFVDSDGDGLCKSGPTDFCDACTTPTECQKIISLPRNMMVQEFKKVSDNSSVTGPVFVTFKRPDPEAIILDSNSTVITSGVNVIVKSPDNQYKKIVVRENGYISVEDYQPTQP